MKLNIKYILLLEKIGAIIYLFLPEALLRGLKKLIRNDEKRSQVLSNTKGYFDMRIKKAMNNFDMCQKTAEFRPQGKTALEFGTGGHGIDLVMLYLLGVKKIYTVDIAFFGLFNMPQAIEDFEPFLGLIAKQFDLEENTLKEKHNIIKGETDTRIILDKMNVQFITFKQLLKRRGIISDKVDFFFSESALQRVPLKQLTPLLDNIHFSSDAIMFHKINCSDINILKSRVFRDPKLWRFDYLKYSDARWNLITTKRFGSQNRLRQAHYIEFFKRYGFTTCYVENYYAEEEDIDKCRSADFNYRFSMMDPENVAIANFRIVSKVGFDTNKSVEEKIMLESGSSKEIEMTWQA